MASNLSKHLGTLSKRGPHRVLVGDLSYVGLPGKLYTPESGKSVPAIAFGHDWLNDISCYHGTLRHLASWGIAVAAPNTETGLAPDHTGFASDLETCVQILGGVKLGAGKVTVSPHKLGLVGHGMGGGCAVLAAADRSAIAAVAAIFPAVTNPKARDAAPRVKVPGLILGTEEEPILEPGNAAALANAWGGKVCYRELKDAKHSGVVEGLKLKNLVRGIRTQHAQLELTRGLLTGFLLATLDQDRKYADFADPEATAKKLKSFTAAQLADKLS